VQTYMLRYALVTYLAATALFLFAPSTGRVRNPGWILFALGFLFHTLLVGLRWREAGRPPFANMYEALVLLAWCVAFVYIIFSAFARRIVFLGGAVGTLVVVVMNIVAMLDSSIVPLMPALQSKWIGVHVVTYFIGYGGMTLSFIAGIYYLIAAGKNAERAAVLDTFGYRFIAFAFPFLTIGMTTGSVWANSAWGTYWGWDPKETCSLITWLVYALYLHLRVSRGWKERKAAYLSIIGYLAVLFTFVGVNFILPGLHSYASS
jgi:cytochrome c-type biogenesis protein CcsB